MYIKGLGIEDLEGCKWFFAKSNDIASSTCYASEFHCQQAIVSYCEHLDTFETYQNLGTFLLNNYKQALTIIKTKEAVYESMKKLGAMNEGVIKGWLCKEESYLWGLKKEPEEETMEMEYYKELLNFRDCQYVKNIITLIFD